MGDRRKEDGDGRRKGERKMGRKGGRRKGDGDGVRKGDEEGGKERRWIWREKGREGDREEKEKRG